MATKHPKFTEGTRAALIEAVSEGLYKSHAAARGGVSIDTLDRWLAAGDAGEAPFAEFALEYRAAEADLAREYLGYIRAKAKGTPRGIKTPKGQDWKAAAWFLEKRFPLIYGSGAAREPRREPPPADDSGRPHSPWPKPSDGASRAVQ